MLPLPGSFRFSEEWMSLVKNLPETGMSYKIVTITLKDGKEYKQAVIVGGILSLIKGLDQIPFTEKDVEEIVITHDKWDWKS